MQFSLEYLHPAAAAMRTAFLLRHHPRGTETATNPALDEFIAILLTGKAATDAGSVGLIAAGAFNRDQDAHREITGDIFRFDADSPPLLSRAESNLNADWNPVRNESIHW